MSTSVSTNSDRPSSGNAMDVSAASVFSTVTAQSDDKVQEVSDIIQKLTSYELPESLKCKFGDDALKVQEFMNGIGSSLSRNSRWNEIVGRYSLVK